ncbi:ATP-dependent acyl-CoA ligase [Ktedonosporobacter rubrisoli]|uniref:ATP-dependent acyl-CoA ligase n=1 Tax=Ktedonosporobacter rubrisoli TaxID=2509675 RepID=A0A4V0YYB3_KTERU|nr:AMP-binding protein [Ktedonosporobacter rubrisoli]QBD75621.1 ATP-dependent acyl-CoA ligase [Ktedonosporobacter rubrisoli]
MHILSSVGKRTLAGMLAAHACHQPEREFLIFEDTAQQVETFSWKRADEIVNRIAALFYEHGVSQGTKVNIHLTNCPEFVFSWFACARLGAIIVPTNTASSLNELSYILQHAECKISVTAPAYAQQFADIRAFYPVLQEVFIIDQEPFATAMRSTSTVSAPSIKVRSEDEAAILYTSGTTAKPKGVLVTHANYVYAGETIAKGMRLGPEDRFLTVLPLFHGNAQYYSMMSVLVTGATLLLMDRFSASRYFAQAIRHRASVASLFAAPMRMLLAQPYDSQARSHRLRLAIFAQNLSPSQLQEWEERFAVPLMQIYGMTETMGTPLMNPLDDKRDPLSIGRPAPGYVCRVVDDNGNDVPAGIVGQLLVGGLPGISLMRGYYKDEAATKAALKDGWLYTGDNVSYTEDGYVYFVDRRKDMIKRAGENIAASEVESVIKEHPAIFDVAVVGVPDAMRDEAIVAFVVPRQGSSISEQEVMSWCSARLAKFKVPSFVQLVDTLPRTSVGKIQKHVLRLKWQAAQQC